MIELNNFYVGESVTFMRNNIPDNFVDLTVTSPPYDNLRIYNGFIFDYQSVFKELYRVTKDGGVVVWVVGDATIKGSETGTSFKHALYAKEIGFNLHDTMVYQKETPTWNITSKRYKQHIEYMFILSKGKVATFNPIEDIKVKNMNPRNCKSNRNGNPHYELYTPKKEFTCRGNIWRYAVGSSSTKDKIAFEHPAIFPEQLAQDHILTWSNEGDIVFDPMCGSGTTCKMAWLNKRNFIGIDISEEYINNICIPRLNTCGWQQDNNTLIKNVK